MGVPPYPAITITKWFIWWAEAGNEELSSLKLHTLLSRAQRHYLARYGRSLLIQPHDGPVAPQAGHAVTASGACLTGPGNDDASTGHDVDPATASFLAEVWDTYGGCYADVKLVIPARRRQLPGTAPDRGKVPVGGAA
jgi:uncharacterized phage-associated protein